MSMLKGKTALVTGSTSGIGLGIALALARQGANIVLNGFGDVDGPKAEVQEAGKAHDIKIGYHGADMSKAEQIADMMKYAAAEFGRVDILVNNAGIQHVAPIQDFPIEKWDSIIAINLSSAFHTTRLVLPTMQAANWGRIINVASVHGLVGSAQKSAYVAAKARIFENMDETNCILLNADDPYTPMLKKQAEAHTHVCLLSTSHGVEEGACLSGDRLVLKRRGETIPLCTAGELLLKGKQNIEDCLAAAFLAHEGGVDTAVIIEALKTFAALPNRIEFVRKLDGVSYYNDSKATNTDAAIKGMEAFDKPVILIAGGHDKGTPLSDFMQTVRSHTKELILLGAAAERFEEAAREAGVSSIHRVSSMKEAVLLGQKLAKAGDVVILSPACSSFDMYKNMEERGMDFKKNVKSLM